MKIIFASQNAGKVREVKSLLQPTAIEVSSLAEWGPFDVPEPHCTFIENALEKARYASALSGLPALADDSGLIVNVLNGAPGVHSARFAGMTASSQENIAKLLDLLKDVPLEKRHARFYCVLVFIKHPADPQPLICEGEWQGLILERPRGEEGFGYDPIFFDPTLNATAAECALEIKNKISHRGKALQGLLEKLSVIPAQALCGEQEQKVL